MSLYIPLMIIKGAEFIQFPFMAFFGKPNKFNDPRIYFVKSNIFPTVNA